MHFLGWRLLLISIILFVIDFLTLGNVNFTTNPILERIGQIIGIILVLSFVINLIVIIVNFIRKVRKHAQEEWEKKSPAERRAIRIKRLIGYLLLLWLFVIFPTIALGPMGILSQVSAGGQGKLIGMMLFLVMVTIGTVIPGLYLSPLIICIFPLFLLSIYFIFSKSWHKWRDPIFIIFMLLLTALQIHWFILLIKPDPTLEYFRGENKFNNIV